MGIKQSDAKPGEKLLALYTLLLVSSRALSLKEIASRLETSKQTVLRLLNQMESSNYGKLLVEKRGKENFYTLDKPPRPTAISINADGLAQLAQWRELMLRLLPGEMRDLYAGRLDGGSTYLADAPLPITTISESLSKGKIDYSPFEEILDSLLDGISENLVCVIGYRAKRGHPEKTYSFAPKRLLTYHETIYILGYRVTEEDPVASVYENELQLALQRFTACLVTSRSSRAIAEPPTRTDAFGIMRGEPFEAVISFGPAAATYACERQWSENQKLEEREDGSVLMRITVHNDMECIAWILSFGPDALVLEPKWLRDKIREKIAQMAGQYENS